MHSRDLDAYATIADPVAGLDQEDDDGYTKGEDQVPGELPAALEWAAPGCASSSSRCPGRSAMSCCIA
ncbi:hypothetical protein ACFC1R_33915 [Kitasatospora sp. NPDC056138]|uniref:hypothetical protein n=1 Tax=Kitasatospora sp. NPDC056138 TaxID=3345724 RepID=UPI0035DF988B